MLQISGQPEVDASHDVIIALLCLSGTSSDSGRLEAILSSVAEPGLSDPQLDRRISER